MALEAGPTDVDGVRGLLDDEHGVTRYRFVDRATAYAEFQRRYREDEELVNSIDPADFQESFRVQATDRAAAGVLGARLEAMTGVDGVAYPGDACDGLRATGVVP